MKRIIIYNCYGGSHSSVTAAAIHLGMLPGTRGACNEELLSLPYYDAQVSKDHGRIRFLGWDENGNDVFVASKRNLGKQYERMMDIIARITGAPQERVIFVDTMPYVNIWMIVGGFLSRRWGFNKLGRFIVLYGTRRSYYKFIQLVQQVKQRVRTQDIWWSNEYFNI